MQEVQKTAITVAQLRFSAFATWLARLCFLPAIEVRDKALVVAKPRRA
jgi:hypothetical protein